MKYGICFLALSGVLLFGALQRGGWYHAMVYPALSFAIVAIGYLGAGPRVFGKYSNGKRMWVASVLLQPYLLFTLATWHLVRMTSREPAVDRIDADLYLSRRLLTREVPETVNSVVDLTCEFTDPTFECSNYFCFPMLDADCPSAEELHELAKRVLELPKPLLIHCAQGHGRTGLVAAAVLLASGKAATSAEAVALVKAVRPGIELNRVQRKSLDSIQRLKSHSSG